MTGAGRYAELAAAVRCFKAELIQPSKIERLAEAGSLSETVSMLTGGHVTSTDGSDLAPVESYLIHRVIEVAHRLAAYAPHDSRPLLKLFLTAYEYACIKEMLKSIVDQLDPEEALRHIVPAGKFTSDRCKELIESRNPNRVIETLGDEALKRFVTPKLTAEKDGTVAVAAVDQYYYARLWAASNLPDPLDAQSARGLVGELIDHLNILLSFRARLVGLDARSTSDMMIPVNYGLGHAFSELSEATGTQNLIRVLDKTPYARSLQGSGPIDGSAAAVERALNRSHATSCLNAFAGSPFNVGLALAFLFLKNYELRDLFSIINAKANNVPADRVMESLTLRRH
jgi:vacuolar-type H+-ATPase subunit C/Vma6